MGPTEPNMASTHDESGASFPDPESFGGPEEFATALFDANAEDGSIGKDRFVGLGHCCFESMCKLNEGPEADVKRMLRGILGPMGEKEKCKDAAKEIVTKVGSEVVPFVAAEIFDWMDQDKDKGVTREELDVAITAAMQGPAAAFGMIFQAIDHNKDEKLSCEELSQFFAKLAAVGGKCALVFIDVCAATFKDDIADTFTDGAFDQLDANGDGALDKEELSDLCEVLGQMKQGFASGECQADPEGPQKQVYDLLVSFIEKCRNAGDLDKAAFHNFLTEIVDAEIEFGRKVLNSGEFPVPPELIEKFMPIIETAIKAFQEAFQANMKSVSEAYFDLLDADSDGIIQSNELMAIGGIFDKKASVDQSFYSLFAMADTDGDGSIDKAESSAFVMKCIALMVSSAKGGVAVYQNVAIAMAGEFFKLLLESVCGGEELTKEQFGELAQGFAEDGPEALM